MSLQYYLGRIARALLTLFLVITFVFIILRVIGDPVVNLVGESATMEEIEYYAEKWGLNKPLWTQYVGYFRNILQGDMGIDFSNGREATEVVFEKIPKTLLLSITSLVLSLAIGIPAGIYTALHRGKTVDRIVTGFAVFGFSMPNFFLGILLILLFSLQLRLLPSYGSGTLAHMVMPVITLVLRGTGSLARFTRSSMLEVMNQSYMRTAMAKGNSRRRCIYRHALPNAIIPILTVLGFRIGRLLGGAVIVETVFAWPGVGTLLVQSVKRSNLSIVQVIVILAAVMMISANLFVDYAYGWVDPRIRRRQRGAV